jgi:ketosteroid isomerase-like protein
MQSMEQQINQSYIEKAQTFYALVQEGKWDEASAFVSDDFTIIEAQDLPFGGTVQGRGAIQKSFTALSQCLDITSIEFQQMTQGGAYIVSILDIVVKGKGGRELRLGIAEVLKFNQGLISEVRPYYFDHDAVHEAVEYKSAQRLQSPSFPKPDSSTGSSH